jgi:hypothetical protein
LFLYNLYIQIVLDQFVLNLMQIRYIQIRYIQFRLKIGHVIQIVVHQHVPKMSAKTNPSLKKNWSSLIPRYAGIRRISTKEKKNDPL